jgi:hypothetical protein
LKLNYHLKIFRNYTLITLISISALILVLHHINHRQCIVPTIL